MSLKLLLERTPDDHSVGSGPKGLLRARMVPDPEPYEHWEPGGGSTRRPDERTQVDGRAARCTARGTVVADEIQKTARRLRDPFETFGRYSWGREQHEGDPLMTRRPSERAGFFQGKVGDDQPGRPGARQLVERRLESPMGGGVRIRHHRRGEHRARDADRPDQVAPGRTVSQGGFVRRFEHRTVGDRVREWKSELERG